MSRRGLLTEDEVIGVINNNNLSSNETDITTENASGSNPEKVNCEIEETW